MAGPGQHIHDDDFLCTVDGQGINIDTMASAVEKASATLRKGDGFTFFTVNLDHLCKRRKSRAFREAYERATFISADGAPVAMLARSVGAQVSRTTGADMVEPMMAMAAAERLPVFLFGSCDDVLTAAAERLTATFPGLIVAGTEAPPMGFDPTSPAALEAADRIAASGARICLVALGAPKQELFADLVFARHPHLGFFCIGAALDFIAGRQRRAPDFMSRSGLEWLWRLIQEPRRLVGRYTQNAILLADLMVPWRHPHPVTKGRMDRPLLPPGNSGGRQPLPSAETVHSDPGKGPDGGQAFAAPAGTT